MKSKILIGVICFALGALAGRFGPGIVKAEIEAHQEDSEQTAPAEETPSTEDLKEELTEIKEAAAEVEDEVSETE